jgi:hypothetical protein
MKILFLLLLAFAGSIHADPPWGGNVRVSVEAPWDTLNQGESCFAVRGDSIFVICNTAERSQVPVAPYAYSFDGGESFQQIPFTDSAVGITWHTDPVIAVDDSAHVHMLIQFSLDHLNHYLSRDGGLTWSDTVAVASDYGVDKPWMVINGGEIYITWEQVSGQIGVWLAKSNDYGKTFTSSRIWNRTGITALAMDEDENLHLALLRWTEGLYYRKSTDKGESWSEEQYLSDNYYEASYGDRFPINSITVRGDIVFIAWVDSRYADWDIWGIRSTDGGDTWEEEFVVNDLWVGGQCKCWTLFDPHGGLHVTYYSTPDWPTAPASFFSLRYQYSPDSGRTFYPSVRVSDTAAPSMADFMGEYHVIQSDSQYVYAIWTDGRNGDDNDLYFSKALISDLTGVHEVIAEPTDQSHVRIPTLWHGPAALEIGDIEGPVTITIHDCAGRVIRQIGAAADAIPRRIRLTSKDFPSGVLFIRVTSHSTSVVKKIVNLR